MFPFYLEFAVILDDVLWTRILYSPKLHRYIKPRLKALVYRDEIHFHTQTEQ